MEIEDIKKIMIKNIVMVRDKDKEIYYNTFELRIIIYGYYCNFHYNSKIVDSLIASQLDEQIILAANIIYNQDKKFFDSQIYLLKD